MPKVLGEKDAANVGGFELVVKNRMARINDTYSRLYYVLGDNLSQNEEDIVATSGIPPLGSLRGQAYCMSRNARELNRIRHPMTGAATVLWEVEARFDSSVGQDISDAETAPEDRLPKRRWYGETEEERLETDAITGEPIQTKAGEPMYATVPVVCPILEVVRWKTGAFDPDAMVNYSNHTNSLPFYGAPKGCALLMPIEADEELDDGSIVTQLTFKVKFKIKKKGSTLLEDTWAFKPVHNGQQYRNLAGKIVRNLDDDQNPVFINLAADGSPLAEGEPLVYLHFNRFARANFNDLEI